MSAIPLIGITASIDYATNQCSVNYEYCEAVKAAGGMPVVLAPLASDAGYVEDALNRVDGLVLSGGGDMNPATYGHNTPNPSVAGIENHRDAFELRLAERAFERSVPTLGVCRGMQVMNVALGGTLHQDLSLIEGLSAEDAAAHGQNRPFRRPAHAVSIAPGTLAARIFQNEGESLSIRVNSMHHQAVCDIAPALSLAATCGPIAEALEAQRGFYLGVQWHPEYLENGAPLFRALANAARSHHALQAQSAD